MKRLILDAKRNRLINVALLLFMEHEQKRLYHVSEDSDICIFNPRPSPSSSNIEGEFVWAVDQEHLPNYLLPRDCPRVCFACGAQTLEADVVCFLKNSAAMRIIAIEWDWLERLWAAKLHIYSFDSGPFRCVDAGAGYYVSPQAVIPMQHVTFSNILAELSKYNVELRIVKDLWPLHNDVANSSLEFSMIRMRNASRFQQELRS